MKAQTYGVAYFRQGAWIPRVITIKMSSAEVVPLVSLSCCLGCLGNPKSSLCVLPFITNVQATMIMSDKLTNLCSCLRPTTRYRDHRRVPALALAAFFLASPSVQGCREGVTDLSDSYRSETRRRRLFERRRCNRIFPCSLYRSSVPVRLPGPVA